MIVLPEPIPAKACRVVPPIWHAATPVLAVGKVWFGGSDAIILFNKNDFPVPALPVKNKLLPFFTASKTRVCSAVSVRAADLAKI